MGAACNHPMIPTPNTRQREVSTLKGNMNLAKEAAINSYMKQSATKARAVVKILLLGSGSSGKSTLFRQIDNLHGDKSPRGSSVGYGRPQKNMPYVRRTIRANCITALYKLLKQSLVLAENPYNFEDVRIKITPETEEAIKLLAQWVKGLTDDGLDSEMADLGKAMAHLWQLRGVRATFRHRHHFSLIENADFFLDNVEAVMAATYVPSMEHSIKARMRTLGIIEQSYTIQRVRINIFDVGGQRNERRKWLSLFDCVDVLIYVAALNHYSCALFEDESKNAMQESLELFREMVNSKWFPPHHTRFVLFLNKNDAFRHRLIKDGVPMSVAFGDEYQSDNFADAVFSNEAEQKKWEERCYAEALAFIKAKYLQELGGRHKANEVFVHVTTATDLCLVKDVFDQVIHCDVMRDVKMLSMQKYID